MLILTDCIQRYLPPQSCPPAGGPCHVVDLRAAETIWLETPIILCDADLREDAGFERLSGALAHHRTDPAIPVLLLYRDVDDVTSARIRALGVTAIIDARSAAAQIAQAVDRLLNPVKISTPRRPPAPTTPPPAHVEDVKASLAACFDAVRQGKPISFGEVDRGARIVVSAMKKDQIRQWLDFVRQLNDVTYQHCLLVTGLISALALKLGLTLKHQHLLTQAGLLHDIGKAYVPLAILDKPGPLTAQEMQIMRGHVTRGHEQLVRQGGFDPLVLGVVRHHHEFLDGSGYPDRLRGAQIPGYVRMATICDIYGALVERRPYKAPMRPAQAMAILKDMAGKLDADLLRQFEAAVLPD